MMYSVRPFALVAALVLVSPLAAQEQGPKVNPQAKALADFGNRLREYLDLHKNVEAKLPSVSAGATPDAIDRHKSALVSALKQARHTAREGDIFGGVGPQFRLIIRKDIESRDVRDVFAAMQEVPRSFSLHVNDTWPVDAPRPTVPPRLLAQLYALPPDLEYRFVERHLVLVDIDAELIVDIVRDVVPSIVRRRL